MTTITQVIAKEPQGRQWWLIVDAEGIKYSTRNLWIAALAERCREKQTKVLIGSSAGWFYRDLYSLRPDGQEVVVA